MFYIFFRASLSAIGYLMHSIYCHDFLETNLSNRQGRSQYCHPQFTRVWPVFYWVEKLPPLRSFICAQIFFFNMNWIYNIQAFIWMSLSFFSAISGLHLPLRKRMAQESKVVIYLLPGLAIATKWIAKYED